MSATALIVTIVSSTAL